MADVIKIFDPNDEPFGPLSNNAFHLMHIDGEQWSTVTNYAYSNMMCDPLRKQIVHSQKTARNVKETALEQYHKCVDENIIKGMIIAIKARFSDPELKQQLLDTGDAILIYRSNKRILGTIRNEAGVMTGQNMLGKELQKLRTQLRIKGKISQKDVEEDNVYNAYLAYQVLLNYMENDEDINDYRGQSYEEIIDNYPGGRLAIIRDTFKRDVIVQLYRDGKLHKITKKELEHPGSMIDLVLEKYTYIGGLRDTDRRFIIFDVITTDILKKNYPDIPNENIDKAKAQQYAKLTPEKLAKLIDSIVILYYENKISPELVEEVHAELKKYGGFAEEQRLSKLEEEMFDDEEESDDEAEEESEAEEKGEAEEESEEEEKGETEEESKEEESDDAEESEESPLVIPEPDPFEELKQFINDNPNLFEGIKEKDKIYEASRLMELRRLQAIPTHPAPEIQAEYQTLRPELWKLRERERFPDRPPKEGPRQQYRLDTLLEELELPSREEPVFRPIEPPEIIEFTDPRGRYGFLAPDYQKLFNVKTGSYPTIRHYIIVYVMMNSFDLSFNDAYANIVNQFGPDTVYIETDTAIRRYSKVGEQTWIDRLEKYAEIALDKKFEDINLQNLLLSTGTNPLIFNDKTDPILGVGKDGSGMDKTGRYLMNLRQILFEKRGDEQVFREVLNIVDDMKDKPELSNWIYERTSDVVRISHVLQYYLLEKVRSVKAN